MFPTVSQLCVGMTTASWEIQGQYVKIAIPQKSWNNVVDVWLSSLIFMWIHTHFFFYIPYPFSLSSIFAKVTCFLKSPPLCMVNFCSIWSFNLHRISKNPPFLFFPVNILYQGPFSLDPFIEIWLEQQFTIYKFCSAASQAPLLLMSRGSLCGSEQGVHTRT